jgi:hypothetical protein
MKYFYLYIFLLLLFIFLISYYNTYISEKYFSESFDNQKSYIGNNTIILLGDSILKNNSYVSAGKSVDAFVKKNNKGGEVYSFAANDSKIVDVYEQINKLPLDLNNEYTTIFLSVGGNNILELFQNDEDEATQEEVLTTMIKSYKKLVKSIQTRMNKSKIVLLDLYYPENIKYKQYHNIIQKWNSMLREIVKDNTNNINGIVSISELVTNSNDFTLGIEPSELGGEKIANAIVNY